MTQRDILNVTPSHKSFSIASLPRCHSQCLLKHTDKLNTSVQQYTEGPRPHTWGRGWLDLLPVPIRSGPHTFFKSTIIKSNYLSGCARLLSSDSTSATYKGKLLSLRHNGRTTARSSRPYCEPWYMSGSLTLLNPLTACTIKQQHTPPRLPNESRPV